MIGTINILRTSLRRLLLASALGAALVALATYILIRVDSPMAVIVVFPVLVGLAVLMQALHPGAGITLGPRLANPQYGLVPRSQFDALWQARSARRSPVVVLSIQLDVEGQGRRGVAAQVRSVAAWARRNAIIATRTSRDELLVLVSPEPPIEQAIERLFEPPVVAWVGVAMDAGRAVALREHARAGQTRLQVDLVVRDVFSAAREGLAADDEPVTGELRRRLL
jgi:hypothetical protein